MHRLVQIGVAVAALGLITRTWLVEGLVDPVVVSGGSMAPTLLGAHRRVTCHDCGFAFACGEESLPEGMLAVCPNCGADSDLEPLPAQGGDRLIIDRAAYGLNRPERWDVAILRTPDDPLILCVKRVVGLPGETVEIRDGDVYADGRPVRRSLRQLLAMAIPVYDASCRPTAGGSPRWLAEHVGSRWRQIAAGFECPSRPDSAGAPDGDTGHGDTGHGDTGHGDTGRGGTGHGVDWLVYRHQQTIAGGRIVHRVGPILDDLAYNQNESRELLAVPDVILRCQIESLESGQLWLLADDGRRKFEVEIDAETGSGELWSGGDRLARFSAGGGALDRSVEIVLALVDAQLRLTLGGRLLVDYAYDPAGLECRPHARPLAVGSKDSGLSVTDLKVLRDVYYLASGKRGSGAPRRLGEDEYWLLGDNSAVSVDSRSWPAARANLFIGKALIHRTPR